MYHERAIGGPAVLAYLRDRAAVGPLWVLPLVHVLCSPAEKRQALYPDRGLVHSCGRVGIADRAEPPSEVLRPRSCGCSPLARLDGVPLIGQRAPVCLPEASGRPGPVRVE